MNTQSPRKKGVRPLADLVAAPIAAALQKAGFAATEVVTQWDEIVGDDLAKRCAPVRIAWPKRMQSAAEPEPGTLHVRVEAPFALEVQHFAPVIIERVNVFFGWRCVAAMRLTQVPMTRKTVKSGPRRAPPDERRLARALEGFEDEALRRVMERFGRAVGRRATGA
jgi:hypothetical protein